MLSANVFKLDWSQILSFGKELKKNVEKGEDTSSFLSWGCYNYGLFDGRFGHCCRETNTFR